MRDATRAIEAVEQALRSRGWSHEALGKNAGMSPNTVRTFLSGERWPNTGSLMKIETALEWPSGRIEDIAQGIDRRPDTGDPLRLPENLAELPPAITVQVDGMRVTVQSMSGATEDEVWEAARAAADSVRQLRRQAQAPTE